VLQFDLQSDLQSWLSKMTTRQQEETAPAQPADPTWWRRSMTAGTNDLLSIDKEFDPVLTRGAHIVCSKWQGFKPNANPLSDNSAAY
jgi:hypothetical protein